MMFACFQLLARIRGNFMMLHVGFCKVSKILQRTRYDHARSGLLDRCPLGVDQLPAPVPPNEYAGPAALFVNRSILVFSFGGGTIGHDGGIPVEADFDLIRDQRVEIHAPALAILQVLRRVSTFPCGR